MAIVERELQSVTDPDSDQQAALWCSYDNATLNIQEAWVVNDMPRSVAVTISRPNGAASITRVFAPQATSARVPVPQAVSNRLRFTLGNGGKLGNLSFSLIPVVG